MIIRILGVGETKLSYLKEGEADYLKRIAHYVQLRSEWLKAPKLGKKETPDQIKKKEAEILASRLTHKAFLIALDVSGEPVSSEQFSEHLSDWMTTGVRELVFVIGGPYGLDSSILQKADWILSLSRMTFTHDMTRLILLEQIYRGLTILKGEKYHK